MSDTTAAPAASSEPEHVQPDEVRGPGEEAGTGRIDPPVEQEEMVTSPAKVMRIGSMVKQLLEEVGGVVAGRSVA